VEQKSKAYSWGGTVEITVKRFCLEELLRPEVLSDPVFLLHCTNATKCAAGIFLVVLLFCKYVKSLNHVPSSITGLQVIEI